MEPHQGRSLNDKKADRKEKQRRAATSNGVSVAALETCKTQNRETRISRINKNKIEERAKASSPLLNFRLGEKNECPLILRLGFLILDSGLEPKRERERERERRIYGSCAAPEAKFCQRL